MALNATQHPVLIVVAVIAVIILVIVMSRPAFWQKPNTVVIREPGRRLLGRPQAAQPEAKIDLEYALISLSAYTDITKDKTDNEKPCIDTQKILNDMGWSPWPDFPSTDLQSKMNAVHLRADVWTNRSKGLLVVAFGGTVFSNWKDWKSNLHWLNPFQRDEYTVVIKEFGPQFRDEFLKRKTEPSWTFLQNVTINSTGHSLGGGLAQEFAYSLPGDLPGAPRVSNVYAFDPSPVTGFLTVARVTRQENKNGLKIDRIYERGEVLAILRSITSTIHRPPDVNPEVRQLRYNLFGNDWYGFTNPISGHSIQQLACKLEAVANPH